MVSVPKPTQVGGKNILRRTRELSLRNSANYPRNFGRRGALQCDYLRGKEHWGAAEKWPRRLFNKNTALCKVVLDEVYGVQPAQCQKVKRRG